MKIITSSSKQDTTAKIQTYNRDKKLGSEGISADIVE